MLGFKRDINKRMDRKLNFLHNYDILPKLIVTERNETHLEYYNEKE